MAEPRRIAQRDHAQLVLFEQDEDGKYTNTVDLYDIAPRFVFYPSQRTEGKYLQTIRREFEYGNATYRLLLRPGRIVRPNGEEVDEFPAEREQTVETVILRIATERGRLRVHNDKVRLAFSLYEVQRELRRLRHSLAIDEIKEALSILHTAIVEISRVDKKTTTVLSSSSFPILVLRKRDDLEEENYVEFNPLVEAAIKQLHYRQINYELLMRIRNPIARWLYKRLFQTFNNVEQGGPLVTSMTAKTIARDAGVAPRSRERDTLRRVVQAVKVLEAEGIIEETQPVPEKVGRKNDDFTFDLVPTRSFLAELRQSERMARDGRERLRLVAGTDRPDRFVGISRSASIGIRHGRRMLRLEDGSKR